MTVPAYGERKHYSPQYAPPIRFPHPYLGRPTNLDNQPTSEVPTEWGAPRGYTRGQATPVTLGILGLVLAGALAVALLVTLAAALYAAVTGDGATILGVGGIVGAYELLGGL